ncbi:MAG: hypothetical protein RBU29_05540, partial [bacterium]|nr:hypothetical protein [bacterium]
MNRRKCFSQFVFPIVTALLIMGSIAGFSAELPRPIAGDAMTSKTTFDPRVRQYITPQRVVWFSNDEAAVVENPESLLEMRSGQVTLDAHDPCVLRTQGKPAGILLDFGKELQGGVQIMGWHSKGNKPVRLRVRFGESVSEAMSD